VQGRDQEFIAQQPADFAPDKGLSVMQNILQAQPKIDAGYTTTTIWRRACPGDQDANRDKEMWLTGVGGSRPRGSDQAGRAVPRDVPVQPDDGGVGGRAARLLAKGQGLSDLNERVIPT